MEFRVLGSLEVVDRGAVVSLGGAKQRALLAVLLLNANEVVSADELIDALWGERSLDSGRSALHVRVSQLRKALGRAGAALLTRAPGYVLELDREQLDLHRFERLVAEAEAGEPATAAVKLREALALWRGRPLADLAYESFAQPAIGRMEELRFGAIEKRIDADLALGRHANLVPELAALVSEHPLRERLQAQLMLALYRCGRQAEALEVYQEFRRTLSEQVGLEPGPGLKALQTQLLDQASELDTGSARGEMESQHLAGDLEIAQRIVAPDRVETSQAQVRIEPPSSEVLPPPLPIAASAPVRESSLADRAGELRLCAAAAERMCGGEQRLVLIAGEPGIGKTRLAAELAGKLHVAGMTVLWGRCDPELGVPYQPFVEILTHYTRFAPRHVPVEHRAEYGNELARLVPELAGAVSQTNPGAEQSREENRHVMFAAVEGLLRGAALQRPLVLVIDDLQWADKPTLLLLKYLLLSSQPMRALLVGTYRSTERGEDVALDSLLADLRRQPGVEWLVLGGLPAEDAIDLAQSIAQERLEPAAAELVHGLWEQADGNPFFIGEIVRSLSETGGVNHAARAHAAGERSALLPQSIRETIAVRVARLGERVEQVLSAAAVIGMEFDVELLATACDGSEEQLVEALDAAAVSALITEVPGFGMRFAFVHQLIALALYEQLGAARRRLLHARVVEGLELLLNADQRSRRIGELAQHALRAVPMIAVGKSVEYFRLAGEHALAQLAPQEAMRWFDQALSSREHLDPQAACGDGERLFCDLLIGRGIALEQSGDPESRSTLLRAAGVARRLGDGERLVRAVLANLRPITETGKVDRERIEMLEAALATVGDGDSAPRARLLTALAAELTYSGDWERRKRLSDESLAIAGRLGDPATLTAVISKRFLTIWTPETLQQRRADTELGLATAEPLDDPLALFGAVHWTAAAAVEAGELHLASELVQRQEDWRIECVIRSTDGWRHTTARHRP